MRAYEKRKRWKASCRKQVKEGLINMPDGSWARFDSNKAMHRDQVAGYRFGTSKRRVKEVAEVE